MMEGRSRKEWRQEIERDRVEVAAAWQMVEREQVQELVGDRVEIGQSGLSRLDAEAEDAGGDAVQSDGRRLEPLSM